MKKFFATLCAAVAAVCVLAFAGCEGNVKKTVIDGNSSIILVADEKVMPLGKDTTVEDYLKALKEKGELEFEGSTGDYGFFLTSMNGTANVNNPDNTGSSWMFYIDFITLEGDDTPYASDYSVCEYEGKTLFSASYGVSGVPCVEGHTYAFVYEAYDYSVNLLNEH